MEIPSLFITASKSAYIGSGMIVDFISLLKPYLWRTSEGQLDELRSLAKKRGLMSEKKSAEEVVANSQRGGTPWLEPMREWIKDASMLDEIAKGDDLPSKKSSLPPSHKATGGQAENLRLESGFAK